MDSSDFDVNGTQPSLIGSSCSDLIVEEYWHKGELDNPANVIWLHVDSNWHRLTLDCGVVFWRSNVGYGPKAYEMPELESQVRLTSLGQTLEVAGRVIANVSTRSVEDGLEVALQWDSGDRLVFCHFNDKTSYYTV